MCQVMTRRLYVFDCSVVPLAALLLFGGDLRMSRDRKLLLSGRQSWLKVKVEEAQGVLLRALKGLLAGLWEVALGDPGALAPETRAAVDAVLRTLLMASG